MTPFQIALWKHFIKDKGMATVFINLYRKNHLNENPISIEEFMRNVEPQDVCMKAFRFYVNSDYGYDYWSKITLMWMEFLATNENNYTADEWYKLTGMSKILRTNWDAARHWREETKLTAAIRLGIDPSLIGCDDKTPTAPPTQLSEEYLREKTKEEMSSKDFSGVPEHDNAHADDVSVKNRRKSTAKSGIFSEFELMDLRSKSHESRRLLDDEISINRRDEKGRLTFSQKISKEIKARGGYKHASLLKNKKGELVLLLNDTDVNGANLSKNANPNRNMNVTITSKTMCDKIATFLDILQIYEIINATEIERTDDYVAYLLTKR